jgi:hypothetical protein
LPTSHLSTHHIPTHCAGIHAGYVDETVSYGMGWICCIKGVLGSAAAFYK